MGRVIPTVGYKMWVTGSDRDRAHAIMHRALTLFANEVDVFGDMAVGSYAEGWAGLNVTLNMGEEGTALLCITEPENDGGAVYYRKRFEAHWKAGAALTVAVWEGGMWESAFVEPDIQNEDGRSGGSA